MKHEKHAILVGLVALAAIVTLEAYSPAASSDDAKHAKEAAEQASRAAKAFDAIMQVPDKAIPRDLLRRAKAVAVFPRVIKVALTVGGGGGRGVGSRQSASGSGHPVVNRGARASVGPRLVASSADSFLVL